MPVMPAVVSQRSFRSQFAQGPNPHGQWWSYRLIDGRKCWYEGKPMLSKSLLEWPKEASAQPVSNGKVTIVVTQKPGDPLDAQARTLNDSDTFEARWRERVDMR
jgi:hypothetical protein